MTLFIKFKEQVKFKYNFKSTWRDGRARKKSYQVTIIEV